MFLPTVDIRPNTTGLPGLATMEKIAGALLTFGLVAAVAGIALSAIARAVESHSANPHVAGKGKSGVLVARAAAILIRGSQHPGHLLHPRGRGGALMREVISALVLASTDHGTPWCCCQTVRDVSASAPSEDRALTLNS
jgi:hypothetical protein